MQGVIRSKNSVQKTPQQKEEKRHKSEPLKINKLKK
jgi:hypothetical protein